MFENDTEPVDDITGLLSKTQFKLNLIMVLSEWLINIIKGKGCRNCHSCISYARV